jgi:Zn-dependent protease with chaperone function
MIAIDTYTLPPDKYLQAVQYAHVRYFSHFASFAVQVIVLLAIIRLRLASRLRRARPVSVIFLILVVIALADLPLDALRHSASIRFGISVQGWPSWLWDWLKEQLFALSISALLFRGFYVLLRKSSQRWWLYTWLAALPIMIASVYAEPWLFEPLFNKFTPLARTHPELIAPIQTLLQRAGVSIPQDRFFEMEASAKTNSLNAYVSGFGPSRRVVLYDTIIRKEPVPELLTTFGHELGHYAMDHIAKGIAFGAVLFLIGAYLAFLCVGFAIGRWGTRFDIAGMSQVASLPVFLLFIEVTQFLSEPLVNGYSRAQEHAADVYSLKVTRGVVPNAGEAAARAFQIEGETDLDEPAPHPFIVFWLYSHPPTAERLRFALTYK